MINSDQMKHMSGLGVPKQSHQYTVYPSLAATQTCILACKRHKVSKCYTMIHVCQVAQVARRLATGWTARVLSWVSEGWRFFCTHVCPDWPWGPLNLL